MVAPLRHLRPHAGFAHVEAYQPDVKPRGAVALATASEKLLAPVDGLVPGQAIVCGKVYSESEKAY
eukprot:6248955-Alexandrium_andersonii.AAC.1